MQERGDIVWDTTDPLFAKYLGMETAALPLKPLDAIPGRWHGGINLLWKWHFAIVKGGAMGLRLI